MVKRRMKEFREITGECVFKFKKFVECEQDDPRLTAESQLLDEVQKHVCSLPGATVDVKTNYIQKNSFIGIIK